MGNIATTGSGKKHIWEGISYVKAHRKRSPKKVHPTV